MPAFNNLPQPPIQPFDAALIRLQIISGVGPLFDNENKLYSAMAYIHQIWSFNIQMLQIEEKYEDE